MNQPLPAAQLLMTAEVTTERAYEIEGDLAHKKTYDTGYLVVITGFSVQHGWIHIAIPSCGNALMLPIVRPAIHEANVIPFATQRKAS